MVGIKLAALGVVVAAFAGTAGAADKSGKVGFLDSNEGTCIAREYDAAHMKAHPKQKVTGIALTYAPAAEEDKEAGAISALLVVTFKDSKTKLFGDAYCKAGKGTDVDCIIDEDGGSFTLVKSADGPLLNNTNRIMVMPNLDTYEAMLDARVNIDPKDDQASFLLSSTKSELCKGAD